MSGEVTSLVFRDSTVKTPKRGHGVRCGPLIYIYIYIYILITSDLTKLVLREKITGKMKAKKGIFGGCFLLLSLIHTAALMGPAERPHNFGNIIQHVLMQCRNLFVTRHITGLWTDHLLRMFPRPRSVTINQLFMAMSESHIPDMLLLQHRMCMILVCSAMHITHSHWKSASSMFGEVGHRLVHVWLAHAVMWFAIKNQFPIHVWLCSAIAKRMTLSLCCSSQHVNLYGRTCTTHTLCSTIRPSQTHSGVFQSYLLCFTCMSTTVGLYRLMLSLQLFCFPDCHYIRTPTSWTSHVKTWMKMQWSGTTRNMQPSWQNLLANVSFGSIIRSRGAIRSLVARNEPVQPAG